MCVCLCVFGGSGWAVGLNESAVRQISMFSVCVKYKHICRLCLNINTSASNTQGLVIHPHQRLTSDSLSSLIIILMSDTRSYMHMKPLRDLLVVYFVRLENKNWFHDALVLRSSPSLKILFIYIHFFLFCL